MPQALAGPKLPSPLQAILELAARGLHGAAANGRPTRGEAGVLKMVAVLAKVFHLSLHEGVWGRTFRRFGGEQFFEALDQAMFHVVAQLVQERFNPWAGFSGAWMEVARQFPEILARVIKVERLRSEEHTSELQSLTNLVCRLLLEKKKKIKNTS